MTRHATKTATALALLVLLGVLAGCESEATAPQDELPPVTVQGAATQAGIVAAAVTEASQKLVQSIGIDKDVVTEPINQGGVVGTVSIDFRIGPDGPPATSATATWAHLYTGEGAPLTYTNPEGGGVTTFALGLMADLDRNADTAKILDGSAGTMVSGENVVDFTVTGVIEGSVGYPSDGTLDVTSADHFAQVTFNGTNEATMIVDHERTFIVNLDTGAYTEIFP